MSSRRSRAWLQRRRAQHHQHARPLPRILQSYLAERSAKPGLHHVTQRGQRRALFLEGTPLRKEQLREKDADAGVSFTRDFSGLVRLQHVPLFEVVEAVEQDAAFEAFLDLAARLRRSA